MVAEQAEKIPDPALLDERVSEELVFLNLVPQTTPVSVALDEAGIGEVIGEAVGRPFRDADAISQLPKGRARGFGDREQAQTVAA